MYTKYIDIEYKNIMNVFTNTIVIIYNDVSKIFMSDT